MNTSIEEIKAVIQSLKNEKREAVQQEKFHANQCAKLQNEIDKLEAEIESKENEPWTPQSGNYVIHGYNFENKEMHIEGCDGIMDNHLYVYSGSSYSTYSAAESVAKRDFFYRRLCNLACCLNPSGKLSNKYGVVYNVFNQAWESSTCVDMRYIDFVFETKANAEEACVIMNRDGWKIPQ